MRSQPNPPAPPPPPVHVIRLAGDPAQAFALASRAEDAGRACAESLRRPALAGGCEAVSVQDLARAAAHLARQALGER